MFPECYLLDRKGHPPYTTYTVKHGKRVVGSLLLLTYEEDQCYWLARLYVQKEHRHLHIGRALIQTAVQDCAPWPVSGFIQSVGRNRVGLKRLRRFYLRCGAYIDEADVISWRTDVRGPLQQDSVEERVGKELIPSGPYSCSLSRTHI